MTAIRLLGRAPSINVRKALWTLDEVGVPYVFDEWEVNPSASRLEELARLNPNSMFPILVEAEGPLWESNSICRYITAKAGRGDLLPEAHRARAEVEHWMDWQATDLNDSWRYAFMALQRRKVEYSDTMLIRASSEAWNNKMTILDTHLGKNGPFATGAAFTLADIVLGLSVHRWLGTPMERPKLENIATYYNRLRTRPHFLKHASDKLI
jgi:glutathione S-transferase